MFIFFVIYDDNELFYEKILRKYFNKYENVQKEQKILKSNS